MWFVCSNKFSVPHARSHRRHHSGFAGKHPNPQQLLQCREDKDELVEKCPTRGTGRSVSNCLRMHGHFVLCAYFRMNPNALLSPYVFAFNDDTRIPEGGLKSKKIACAAFSKIFRMSEMGSLNGAIVEGLGSHSIRKFSSMTARKAGITKDKKEIRGRWKTHAGGKRVSDVYDDVELPYPDAKVAQILAAGGPCY